MENREALTIFRTIQKCRHQALHTNDCGNCERCQYRLEQEQIDDAVAIAISALEKQEQDRWHSVAKEGNLKEEKLYIVTKKLNYGNGVIKYEVSVDRWSRNGFGKEWSYNSNSLIVAWRPFPEPYTEEES